MGYSASLVELATMTDILQGIAAEMSELRRTNEQLQESLNSLRLEDVGWTKILGESEQDGGFSLETLKGVTETLRDMAATHPLFKRGAQLRHGYVFGRGMGFDVKPGTQKKMDEPYNKEALFSTSAWETLLLARFTDGNIFVIRDKVTDELTRIPLKQITGYVTDPNSAERIWYVRREWTANSTTHATWYALNTVKRPQTSVQNEPVDGRHVMYVGRANRQTGWTWGVPDSLAAMTWAIAYSEYIKNNATLVRAYSSIAFKLSSATKGGQAAAAASVAVQGGTGGTAIQGPATDLTAMPNMGSGVNFNNGQPIAALVAASFGVSVIALLSSPGAAGGSYGAAQTLDSPTIRVMESVQDWFDEFYTTILRDMKSPNAKVSFPSIETDPVYRQMQSIAQGVAQGFLWREEGRNAALQLVDLPFTKEGLPVPDEFTKLKSDPVPSQGNTGAVGNIASDVTNNDGDDA